ncbi:unnamed protein product [Ceutorhynchus assimilis]|uniref:Transmembrane protein n=1 Tax=Ceutorhynchus assimilis TaxID=467358 RepID=A0A9N9Q9G6_9CUCU|nr:unnamed protein product [Ceutorhynchus assimilis]
MPNRRVIRRPRPAAHPADRTIAISKAGLRKCALIHYLLGLLMLFKLTAFNVEKVNAAIQELLIPEPDAWEWVWIASLLVTAFAIQDCDKGDIASLRYYMIFMVVLGIFPLIWGGTIWFSDAWAYLFAYDAPFHIVYWNGYPAGIIWYHFIMFTLLVHGFFLYFSFKLVNAWEARNNHDE